MERLEPVLKQKFWILLGMGILMTVIGWWMDTGTMAATIATRTADIVSAEGKIPKDGIPNDQWSSGLAALNVQQDLAVKSATGVLWERQHARMTWPETVAEFAWKDGYRLAIDMAGRQNYRNDYENDLRRVWETVRPFNRIDGTGIVDFSMSKLPRHVWGNAAPSTEQMWDAQEDLWLLEGLLQLIAEVNGGANSTRTDAHIHVIEKLTLHGGQPVGQRALPAAAGGSPSGSSGMPEGFGAGSFGGGSGGGGAAAAVSADFDVKEEFGDDGSGAGGQGAAMSSFGSSGGSMGTAGPSAASGLKARRYIDDDKALPFRTRGFYMTLIMDHRKIPNLISELSASEKSAWPIEIIRVQVVRLNDDDLEGRSGGGNGFSPGLSGGGSDAFSGSGGGASGFTESTFGGASNSSGFSLEGGSSGAGGAATAQGTAGLAALTNAVQDPNMSRVAICGIITLYNEVKLEVVVAPAAPSAPPAVVTQPAEAAAPVTEPAADGDSNPAAEREAKPTAADGEPTTLDPAAEGTPKSAGDAPKSDATPPPDTAKPAGST